VEQVLARGPGLVQASAREQELVLVLVLAQAPLLRPLWVAKCLLSAVWVEQSQ
jgi:hypothetical protein